MIFVNVLAGSDMFPSNLRSEYLSEEIIFSDAKRQFSRSRIIGVNNVLSVDTGKANVLDFDARRALIEDGARSARDFTNKLVSQYGF